MRSKNFFGTLCTPPFYNPPFPNPAYGPGTDPLLSLYIEDNDQILVEDWKD